MTIDTTRARAAAFEQRSRRQDLASIAAFSLIMVANAITMAFRQNAMERVGDLLTILASLYVLTHYWRARDASPAVLGVTPSVELYRQNILRRQAMGGRLWMVMLLFVPGILVSTVRDAFASPQPPVQYAIVAGVFAVVFAGFVVWTEWLNRREARRLSDQLDHLDR